MSMIKNQAALLTTRSIVFTLEQHTFMVSKIYSLHLSSYYHRVKGTRGGKSVDPAASHFTFEVTFMSKISRPDPAQFPSLAENYLGEGVSPGQISGDGFSMKKGGRL